jgi:uncharacterized HAD superfamily protein
MSLEKKVIGVDVDGTLCESYDFSKWIDYSPRHWMSIMEKLKPIQKTIDYVNRQHDAGHEVFIFTARDDVYTQVTKKWLKEHGVHFDYLIMKKPYYTEFIDDRTIRPEEL